MGPIDIPGREGDGTISGIVEIAGDGCTLQDVMSALGAAGSLMAADTAGPSSEIQQEGPSMTSAKMDSLGLKDLEWGQASSSVRASIGGSISGLIRPGLNLKR